MTTNLRKFLIAVILVSALSFGESLREGMEKEEMERVVGGYPANDGDYPYAVALYDEVGFICTGSIISQTSILTAGHCVVRDGIILETGDFHAIAGVANRSSSEGVLIKFKKFSVHPGYNEQNNDIAVLETTAPIDFNKRVQRICIANDRIGKLKLRRVVAVGWGQINEDMQNPDLPDVVQYAYQRVVSNWKCRLLFRGNQVPSSIVCASGFQSGICGGDSGGPLVYNLKGESVLVGAASYVNGYTGCGHLLGPAAYSRISFYTGYIKETATGYVCVV